MSMAIPPVMLGRGVYFPKNVVATGLMRFTGILLLANGSRTIFGFAGGMGLDGSEFGVGCALNGLKIVVPLALKSPAASAAVGTLSVMVMACVIRKPS